MGDTEAISDVARCYANGRGVEKDISQAWAWYRKAADAGDTDAKDWLRRSAGN